MNRLVTRTSLAGYMALLVVCQCWGQGQSSSGGSGSTSQPSSGGANRGNSAPTTGQSQPNRGNTMPLYVDGQIIDENGKPPGSGAGVSVKLICGMQTVQAIKADIHGYFRFALGLNNQANTDFGAADDSPSSLDTGGINMPGGFGGLGSTGTSSLAMSGCEIRVAAAGYASIDFPITDTPTLGTFDVGTLQLQRIGPAPTGSVSATSLLVPNNARKEYEQGVKEMGSNHLPQATQHLERAVAAYDKYAEAWTALGRAYAVGHETDKAQHSFEKAIAADPRYAPPYVSLGAIQLEHKDYESALESVAKAVEINPAISTGVGGYIEGVANFQLDHLDAAEKDLLEAEKGPHANTPQLHVILADIYLSKDDSSNAAAHMRAYVKEAPQGPFAAEMKDKLEQIGQAASNNSAIPPAIAP